MTALYAAQYDNRIADAGLAPARGVEDLPARFDEGVAASFRYMRDEGLSNSRATAFLPFLDERDAAVKELTGESLTLPVGTMEEPWYAEAMELTTGGELAVDDSGALLAKSPRAKALQRRVSPEYLRAIAVRERLRAQYPDKVLSDEAIAERVKESLKERRDVNQSVMSRAGVGSQFVGAMGGAMTDPAVLATLPFGLGWQAGRPLINAARAFGSEFLIGAGTEALIQGEVYDFKKSIESPYTKAEAILNVLAAGAGAGVLRATVGGVIDVGVALRRSLAVREARATLEAAGIDPAIASRIVAEIESRDATRPIDVSRQAHSDAVDAAVNAVDEGRLADMPEPDFRPTTTADRIAGDAALRADLEDLVSRAGWAEEGGRVLMREGDAGPTDLEVIGRTSWLPKEDWWLGRPEGITEAKLEAAVKKALAGERLGPRQQEAVEWLVGIADMRRGNEPFLPEPEELAAAGLARTPDDLNESAMVARATDIDEEAVERLAVQYEDDPAGFMAGIRSIIDGREKSPAATGRSAADFAAQARATLEAGRAAVATDAAGRAVAEAVANQPPPKPKVKKDGTPDPEPIATDEIPDVKVAVAEREDGSLETRSAAEAIQDVDARLRALDLVESCVRSAA